jgi:hypothetical protein
VLVCIDLNKKDSEIKVLCNCTDEEVEIALTRANDGGMSGLLVLREA